MTGYTNTYYVDQESGFAQDNDSFCKKEKKLNFISFEIIFGEPLCRWHHPYGRKRRTKELLDESERGEWKSWLKAQHSKN